MRKAYPTRIAVDNLSIDVGYDMTVPPPRQPGRVSSPSHWETGGREPRAAIVVIRATGQPSVTLEGAELEALRWIIGNLP